MEENKSNVVPFPEKEAFEVFENEENFEDALGVFIINVLNLCTRPCITDEGEVVSHEEMYGSSEAQLLEKLNNKGRSLLAHLDPTLLGFVFEWSEDGQAVLNEESLLQQGVDLVTLE